MKTIAFLLRPPSAARRLRASWSRRRAARLSACSLGTEVRSPANAGSPPPTRKPANGPKPRPQTPKPAANGGPPSATTKLNELQTQLRDGSQDLRVAIARFDQARALSVGARSNLFPTVNANASPRRADARSGNAAGFDGRCDRQRLSRRSPVRVGDRSLRTAAQCLRQRAGDRAQASAADLAAVDLALRAELATDSLLPARRRRQHPAARRHGKSASTAPTT